MLLMRRVYRAAHCYLIADVRILTSPTSRAAVNTKHFTDKLFALPPIEEKKY